MLSPLSLTRKSETFSDLSYGYVCSTLLFPSLGGFLQVVCLLLIPQWKLCVEGLQFVFPSVESWNVQVCESYPSPTDMVSALSYSYSPWQCTAGDSSVGQGEGEAEFSKGAQSTGEVCGPTEQSSDELSQEDGGQAS